VSAAARAERWLVAVDGIDGSGKSHFARALAAACEAAGEPSVVLRVDDFRRPLGPIAAGADEAAIYYERYYDFAALDACLDQFLAGAPSAFIPRFDPARELIDGQQELAWGGARFAFLEGVLVLRATNVTRAPLIALEVSEAEARRRILARDQARGRPVEIVEHRMKNRYFPAQRRYRAELDPARRADVLVDNERWDAPRIVRCAPERLPRPVANALQSVVRS
jgi:uridine kinase